MHTELQRDKAPQITLRRLGLYLVSGAVVFGAIVGSKQVVEQAFGLQGPETTSAAGSIDGVDASTYCYVATNLPHGTTTNSAATMVAPSSNQIEVTADVPVHYASEPCDGLTY